MCFYSARAVKAQKLALRYGKQLSVVEIAEQIIEEQKVVNAFTHPLCPIITDSTDIQAFNWGLIPNWVKDKEQALIIRNKTLNARGETIFEKASFKNSILRRRCLIPMTGYFEWRHEGNKRIPYSIRLKEEEVFSVAGIYDTWCDKETGEIINTYSLITTEANELTSYIHNTKKRMPAILSKEEEQEWLDSNLHREDIETLLRPFPAGEMEATIISSLGA